MQRSLADLHPAQRLQSARSPSQVGVLKDAQALAIDGVADGKFRQVKAYLALEIGQTTSAQAHRAAAQRPDLVVSGGGVQHHVRSPSASCRPQEVLP